MSKIFPLFIAFFILFLGEPSFSQEYSYHDFLSDKEIASRINKYILENKPDSVRSQLNEYKNRLGFSYFQYQAYVTNGKADTMDMRYIDSAFMRGATPLCLGKNFKKSDSVKVYSSFQKNYLRAYDLSLINLVDSIHYRDQFYRQKISSEYGNPLLAKNSKKVNGNDNLQSMELKNEVSQKRIDSLLQLQTRTDSSNLVVLNKIISKHGWPGAKLVGDFYCQRPAADATMLVINLGTEQRSYQLEILNQVISLCKKNEESWGRAESLIFNLHSRFSKDFSEFSLLSIKDNKIQERESFFSIYNMSKLLMKRPSEKIIIKCKEISLYKDLKSKMLAMNELKIFSARDLKMYKRVGLQVPGLLTESCFEFISSAELGDNVIFYKFEKK